MQQKGLQLNSSTLIDNLSYTYQPNSNKLQNVVDASNNPLTKLGDFRSSTNYMSSLGGTKTNTATDYTYDNNGNLLKDRNKDIGTAMGDGIIYNHLNLPYQITVEGKGTIVYKYDALGNKLAKITKDTVTANKTTTTDYLNGFVYENNVLQFFAHESGRIRIKNTVSPSIAAGYSYDYFIKDHLGNTRVVLTDEQQQDVYPAATLEDGATATENIYYTINTGAIVNNPVSLPANYPNNNGNPPYNTNPTSNTNATSTKMYKLNGVSGDKTGLGITLKVMSGDVVNIFGKSFWHNNATPVNNNNPIVINDLLTLLAGSSAVTGAAKGITANALTSSTLIPQDLQNWLTNAPAAGLGPKSYLNWVLFDEQFRPVTSGSNSGFVKVGAAEIINPITGVANITKSGYLYVYCSNESNVDVFFDNVQLIHTRGPLLEETHYYPFGLTMAGISSKAAGKLENSLRFNGYEQQSKEFSDGSGLEWYDYKRRFYDNQIGRFFTIDALADKYPFYSPYQFAGNEVPNAIDQDGLEPAYTVIRDGRMSSMPAGDNLRRPIPTSYQSDFNRSMGGNPRGSGGMNPLMFTDVNDATVLSTWITRGNSAINIDGTKADSWDKGAAIAGALIPIVSGSAILKFARHLGVAPESLRGIVKYSGFGGDIAVLGDKTTTVLGRYAGGIENLKSAGAFSENGLNFLNVETKLTGKEFFNTFNKPFLDEAINRGDAIRFVSDPTNAKNLFTNGKDASKGLTTFGMEVDYLKNKGFDINGTTAIKK